ncbi:MAG: xanthine dehydrogenase family protein subunit M [Rhodospirillales bacterium]
MGYERPQDLSDALRLLAEGHWRVLAGGTDLYAATSAAQLSGKVIDVTGIPDIAEIAEEAEGWRLGATATWSQIIAAPLPPAFDALKLAAREVGAIQIQNAGTLAGNLCNASPAADGVPALLILDAEVELTSRQGRRRLPLSDFIQGPRKTALRPEELVTAILVPKAAAQGDSHFLKLGARRYLVISIAMVAVRLRVEADSLVEAALAIGSCSAVARRLPLLEARLRACPLAEAAERLDDGAVATALAPIDDARASGAYRAQAAAELLRRALYAACRPQSEAAA